IGHTITILGLVIDISQAEIGGDDDEQGDDDSQGDEPSAPIQLIAGQFVEVKLASNVPPLVATEIEVKNSGTGIEVEVVDQNGDEIDDDDDDVQVVVTVTPTQSAAVKSKATKGGKKTLTFTAQSKGHTVLSGLPAGRAKLLNTRIHGGHKSSAQSLTGDPPLQRPTVAALLKRARWRAARCGRVEKPGACMRSGFFAFYRSPPVVLGIAPLKLRLELGICLAPEERQVVGHLERPVARSENLNAHRHTAVRDPEAFSHAV